jgi:hypothetical protein
MLRGSSIPSDLTFEKVQQFARVCVTRRGDSRDDALMSHFPKRTIEIETRHTMNGNALRARELEQCFETIGSSTLENRDRLDLAFARAQCFQHRVHTIDNLCRLRHRGIKNRKRE